MHRAPSAAGPPGGPYRGHFAPRAVFALATARYGAQVAGGIAGGVVTVGAMAGLLALLPELARQQVSALHVLIVGVVAAATIATGVRLASGPSLALSFDGDVVSLVTRGGKTLARCDVTALTRETATCRLSVIVVPALVLRFVEARRLVVATNWPAEQLPWRSDGEPLGEPTHLVPVALWPRLLEHLQLATELANPQLVTTAPLAPAELPSESPWGRRRWWAIALIPIGSLVLGMLWPDPTAPSPDCAAAQRCCLAVAHQSGPVSAATLRGCTAMALADETECGALHKNAESVAAKASVSCDGSVLERYDTYGWSEQASSVPGASGQPVPEERYPRVSCRDAALRLQQAVEEQRDGTLLVIRPTSLMVQAISLTDPNAFVYCDGYPLPVVHPDTASAEAPIVADHGPHAVLLQPLAAGRFDVRMVCWGCNRVGNETTRR